SPRLSSLPSLLSPMVNRESLSQGCRCCGQTAGRNIPAGQAPLWPNPRHAESGLAAPLCRGRQGPGPLVARVAALIASGKHTSFFLTAARDRENTCLLRGSKTRNRREGDEAPSLTSQLRRRWAGLLVEQLLSRRKERA